MKSISFVRETFAAGETADITGITTMQQRNMRRLGHDTKAAAKHERRDLYSLAKLSVMKLASDFGIPPGAVTDLAENAAVVIYAWAAAEPNAVNDPNNLANGELPVKFDPGLKRFLIWNGRKAEWAENVGRFYERQEGAGGMPSAVILDLRSVARDLVKRSPKPFWRVVEVED